MKVALTAGAALVASLGLGAAADAGQINTGGETGAYYSTFCPQLEAELKKSKFDYSCATSAGSRENIRRVMGDPSQVAFTQFDVFALENQNIGGGNLFKVLRSDIAKECVFIITRNRDITNFGQVAALASELRFVLPPERSGSTATFEYLQSIDPEGLGAARNVTYAGSPDEAIDQALSGDDVMTLFVQFPDPKNARFVSIAEKGGNLVPVLDRNILRQEIDGKKVYFAEETEINLPKWNKSAKKVVTACTPMLLITGTPDRVEAGDPRKDQQDLIRTVEALDVEQLQPKTGFLAKLWRKTKALSAKSVEKMVELSEKAREKAEPMMKEAMDKAKELTEEAKKQSDEMLKKLENSN